MQIVLWRCWLLLVVLVMCVWAVNHNPQSSALPMIFNPEGLSVLAVQYNPHTAYSDWIPHIFGDKAVFHNRSYDARSRKRMEPHEVEEREQLFKSFFQLPTEAQYPSCSFEFLGLFPVDRYRPFTFLDKLTRPSIGQASLLVDNSEEWGCFYRGVYENPLHNITQYEKQHWPVLFYCPAPNKRVSCANLLQASSASTYTIDLRLTLPLRRKTFHVSMKIDLISAMRKQPPAEHPKAALCTSIPYISSDETRLEVNGALLYEFIRYHSHLGMKVMVFDRGGKSFPYLSPKYIYNRRGEDLSLYDFDYFNFTILEKLRQYHIDIRAESLEGLSKAIVRTDFDKRFSLTYCRYAAKALYGIERVLVLDFDEYIYCPSAAPTAESQARYLARHMDRLKAQGVQQYVSRQRLQVPRYDPDDIKICLEDQIKLAKYAYHRLEQGNMDEQERVVLENAWRNASIFQCVGAYKFLVRRNFDKSFHLGHYCPYTSFHHSSNLRHFDCVAEIRRDFDTGCHAIHVSTKSFRHSHPHTHNMQEVLRKDNEIYLVTNTFEDVKSLKEVLKDVSVFPDEAIQERRERKQKLMRSIRAKNKVKVRKDSEALDLLQQ